MLRNKHAVLLLGIHSWPNSAKRRHFIRRLSPLSDAVDMRFIGSTSLKPEADVLRFDISLAGKTKLLQKYLIANAFLRYAVSQSHAFVGRSEDDAILDAASLAAHLASLQLTGPILYGVRGEWVMWSPTTLTPVCWAATLRRWDLQRARDAKANASEPKGECRPEHVGPVLLTKGPLVVYSRDLARSLVAWRGFSELETHVSSDWNSVLAVRLAEERRVRPQQPRLGVVYAPLAEDVFYSSAIHQAAGNDSLSFVSVPMSEYAWNHPASKRLRPLASAAVYHRIASSKFLNASGLDSGDGHLSSWWKRRKGHGRRSTPNCRPLAAAYKRSLSDMHCCRSWQLCAM